MKLSEGLKNDITLLISKHSLESSPHMKLFWEQQKNIIVGRPSFEIHRLMATLC